MQPLIYPSPVRPLLNVVCVAGIAIEEQLALEEALLRADQENWFLWNQGSSPAVVLGISGKIEELIHQTAWRASGLPLVRRFSGGGTVVVDQETLFASWLINQDSLPHVALQPQALLQFIGDLIQPLGIQIEAQDFTVQGRKVGGNAQYLRRGRWLHHTSFLWNYSPARMNLLKIPSKQPSYRAAREHHEFVRPLSEFLPDPLTLFNCICETLESHFLLEKRSWKDACRSLALPHRKTVRRETWPEEGSIEEEKEKASSQGAR
jgi:lipoate---protein ligase